MQFTMSYITKFIFLGKPNKSGVSEELGHALIREFSDQGTNQYLIEDFILGYDYGRNPNHLNKDYHEGLKYTEDFADQIDELINKETLLATDLYEPENYKFISIGMNFKISKANSPGNFYVFRIPYDTQIIEGYIDGEKQTSISLEEPSKSDAYVMISSTNQKLIFGEGLITTRSYLISKDLTELFSGGYIANFNESFTTPLLNSNDDSYKDFQVINDDQFADFQTDEEEDFQVKGEQGTIVNLVNNRLYPRSIGGERNQFTKIYMKGAIEKIEGCEFLCLEDGATDDFDNPKYWVQI